MSQEHSVWEKGQIDDGWETFSSESFTRAHSVELWGLGQNSGWRELKEWVHNGKGKAASLNGYFQFDKEKKKKTSTV